MLNPKQQKCLKLMVEGNLTQKEIAKQIGVIEGTISEWKKLPEFIDEYNRLLKSGITTLAAKALRTHENLLNAKSEHVRYLTAKDILDRAGYIPPKDVAIELAIPIFYSGEDDLK